MRKSNSTTKPTSNAIQCSRPRLPAAPRLRLHPSRLNPAAKRPLRRPRHPPRTPVRLQRPPLPHRQAATLRRLPARHRPRPKPRRFPTVQHQHLANRRQHLAKRLRHPANRHRRQHRPRVIQRRVPHLLPSNPHRSRILPRPRAVIIPAIAAYRQSAPCSSVCLKKDPLNRSPPSPMRLLTLQPRPRRLGRLLRVRHLCPQPKRRPAPMLQHPSPSNRHLRLRHSRERQLPSRLLRQLLFRRHPLRPRRRPLLPIRQRHPLRRHPRSSHLEHPPTVRCPLRQWPSRSRVRSTLN